MQLTDRADVHPADQQVVQISDDGKIAALGERVAMPTSDTDRKGRHVTVWDIEDQENPVSLRVEQCQHFGRFALSPRASSWQWPKSLTEGPIKCSLFTI